MISHTRPHHFQIADLSVQSQDKKFVNKFPCLQIVWLYSTSKYSSTTDIISVLSKSQYACISTDFCVDSGRAICQAQDFILL